MSINKIKYDELEELKSKNEILINLLNKLIAFDKKRVFLYPVNVDLVPDYLNVIKEPMDFTTMKQKIQNFKYNDFLEFEKDVYLIINNCYTYNDKNTIYHRIAENLENYYKKVSVKMHKKYMNLHFLYHKDKSSLNNVSFNVNASNLRKNYLKEKKKNEKTKKHGKVGRPSKVNANSKNSYMNNSNEFINIPIKKKRMNSKNLSRGIDNMYNNLVDNNTFVSSTDNFVDNVHENNKSIYMNLENMIEEEEFSTIINKIQDNHDKSNDIFHLLIKLLSTNTNNNPILCNYVNINKSLREIFFKDSTFSNNKNNEYYLTDSDDDNNVQLSEKKKKKGLCNNVNVLSINNKKCKLLCDKEQPINDETNSAENNFPFENNDINKINNKNTTESSNSYSYSNNGEIIHINNNDKNVNENCNGLNNDNIKDTNGTINEYLVKKEQFFDGKSKLLKETVTYNIEKEELTMNLLNYKESVKKFIGESNFPTFIKIFPNIYNILDNTDAKDLHYSAFNDLRMFGMDTEDFTEFNNKIVYNDNYLLGVGKLHINNILTLDKNLSNIVFDEKQNSHFSDKLKTHISNRKSYGGNNLLHCNYNDNKHSVNSNKNSILNDEEKTEQKYMFEMENKCKNTINKNYETFNNNSKFLSNFENNSDLIAHKTVTCEEKEEKEKIDHHPFNRSFFNNENNFGCEPKSSYYNYDFSCESSSDDENLNLKNFFITYNSYLNEFNKEKKKKKMLNNIYNKSYKSVL